MLNKKCIRLWLSCPQKRGGGKEKCAMHRAQQNGFVRPLRLCCAMLRCCSAIAQRAQKVAWTECRDGRFGVRPWLAAAIFYGAARRVFSFSSRQLTALTSIQLTYLCREPRYTDSNRVAPVFSLVFVWLDVKSFPSPLTRLDFKCVPWMTRESATFCNWICCQCRSKRALADLISARNF